MAACTLPKMFFVLVKSAESHARKDLKQKIPSRYQKRGCYPSSGTVPSNVRHAKFMEMITSSKSALDSKNLPPAKIAEYCHN